MERHAIKCVTELFNKSVMVREVVGVGDMGIFIWNVCVGMGWRSI